MKIHHVLNGVSIAITNEERAFIKAHRNHIPLSSLNERDMWIAQNLVRKDVYKLTKDSKSIVVNKGSHESNRSSI
jgi:hypothetical protein